MWFCKRLWSKVGRQKTLSKKLIEKDEAFVRIAGLFRVRNEKKKCLFVNIHLPPVFPWRFVVITVREEHRMWLIQLVCFKLVTPLVGTVEFLTRLGDCSVTLEFICEARPVWRSKFAKFAPSLLDHCGDFGKAMKEFFKRITNWSTDYFIHRKSYYPIPELAMGLSALQN